jgi:exosortase
MRVFAAVTVTMTLDRLMFVPCLAAVFLIAGGWKAFRWAAPPIAFLMFMYPLPRVIFDGLLRPLQSIATACSLYALQTLGVESYRDGNRIMLDKVQMGVVDACSGIRMLTIFLALAAAIAMISTTRPWWERLVIVLSAIPIALAVNAARITITGLLYNFNVQNEIAEMILHDAAGLIMMPMALGLLYVECQVLSHLFIDDSPAQLPPLTPGIR